MTDVPALCRQLAVLRRALDAAGTPGRQDDPATPHPAVAAVLTPTPPPAEGRTVPGSRVPIDLTLLETAEDFDAALYGLSADLRRALSHTTRDRTIQAALDALAVHHGHLDDGHPLGRRIPAVLAGWHARIRRVLDLDERWLTLGPCPEIRQELEPVAWDAAGAAVAYVDEVRDCHTYDPLGSYDATRRRGAPVDIWRRSHIRIPRDGDLAVAVASCPGCGREWPPAERSRLAATVEREAVEQLAAAG